jgi:hypothetical protein
MAPSAIALNEVVHHYGFLRRMQKGIGDGFKFCEDCVGYSSLGTRLAGKLSDRSKSSKKYPWPWPGVRAKQLI